MSATRDRVISNQVVEWSYDGDKPQDAAAGKAGKESKKNGKKKANAGPKIELDFSSPENAHKSLLGCFFGEKNVFSFRAHHFQRHPVVSRGHNVTAVREALCALSVEELVANTASDQVHVWLRSAGIGTDAQSSAATLDSITVDDAAQAHKLFCAGHSLYCRAPPQVEALLVPRLLRELGVGIDCTHNDRYRRGEVEMFFSRAGHATDFHTDFQENFTIQLSGAKKWIFAQSTASHPSRGCTPHFTDEKKEGKDRLAEQQLKVLKLGDNAFRSDQFRAVEGDGALCEVILRAGDVLYHPAGVWHRVECIEDSISANISLTAQSFADVFCANLQQLLTEHPLWRSIVFHEDAALSRAGRPTAREIAQSLIEQVPSIVQSLSAEDVLPFPLLHAQSHAQAGQTATEFISPSAEKEKKGETEEEEDDEFADFEEDEEEEEGAKSLEIDSGKVDVLLFLQSLFAKKHDDKEKETNENDQVGEQDKQKEKKRKATASAGLFHEFAQKSLKFNPFAMILSEEEIKASKHANKRKTDNDDLDMDEERERERDLFSFVVHCGFGNETLESTARAVVRFAPAEEAVLQLLLSDYHEERVARGLALFSKSNDSEKNNKDHNKKRFESRVFTANGLLQRLAKDKRNKGLDISDVVRVLVCWHLSGAITILP